MAPKSTSPTPIDDLPTSLGGNLFGGNHVSARSNEGRGGRYLSAASNLISLEQSGESGSWE